MGKKAKSSGPVTVVQSKLEEDSYEGERLDELLQSIQREIKKSRVLNAESLPEKIWLKKQFAVGVNEVTRVLERMTPSGDSAHVMNPNYKACTIRLQVKEQVEAIPFAPKAMFNEGKLYEPSSWINPELQTESLNFKAILLTADCNPRWLTNHVPNLATSRKVPLILVKGKEGSLRLGELVNLKTAIAIGIKANGSPVNQLIGEILQQTT